MMGPRQPVDRMFLSEKAQEAQQANDWDTVYLCGRALCYAAKDQELKAPFVLAQKLIFSGNHVLHGYDLAHTCSLLVADDVVLAQEADFYAKTALFGYLSGQVNDTGSAKQAPGVLVPPAELHALADDLCFYIQDWTPQGLLLHEPLAQSDALIAKRDSWFESDGREKPVVREVNNRLSTVAAFLAVNSDAPDNQFDAQPRFLWGRLIGMVLRQNRDVAFNLALDTLMTTKQGMPPVGFDDNPDRATIGRDRANYRWHHGPCLKQMANGLVLTL